ncbi:nucleotidyltransferase family protein [Dyadobacter fermentans]|uniref:nucleotidyltransferase family protein n=1 Tax=Dyadobacter fermentans TaxID=94254 RepID=UPI001CC02A64|nr:nucleotidyltransferase domain-containing protein [Dyadobacter fermentans]MBZ1358759.1 nucleotidyltransferase domain-containing protein [Dyadobacter fermentans]
MDRLQKYRAAITKLCKAHKVKSLYAFGSVLSDNFNAESDIDLIVDFAHMDVEDYADNYFDFKFSLQELFKRPIDLIEEKAVKNPYFRQNINQQRHRLYGATKRASSIPLSFSVPTTA